MIGSAENAAPPQTILVVEDDEDVLDIVVSHLSTLGYCVVIAHNGPEALATLKERPGIDLIFTDYAMPYGMNGVDLAIKARHLKPQLKVLLTSGYRDARMYAHSPDTFPILAKPYRQTELSAKIREVLADIGGKAVE